MHLVRHATFSVVLLVGLLSYNAAGQTSRPSMLSEQESFTLKQIRFTGHTAFTLDQLLNASLDILVPGATPDPHAPKVRDLVGKPVTLDQLEQARVAITLLYVNAGYINSGAVLDEQPVEDGAVVMRIVEGRLSDIRLSGNQRLRDGYLRSRVQHAGGPPLRLQELRDQLEVMRQNPNIAQINAELRPGAQPGESTLDVRVQENDTFQLGLIFNNHRSPSVGAERFSAFVSHDNLLGFADRFYAQAALTDGGYREMRIIGYENGNPPFSEWPELSLDYTIPISPSDTTLNFSYQKTDSTVIESAFDELDIDSELSSYSITLRQPLKRTPASELAVFVTGNLKRNKTFLLDEPFSFSAGAIDGESNATLIRLGAEYFYRDVQQAMAFRSTLTIGVDAFGATVNAGPVADGQFWAWLGQAQYVRRLGESNIQGVARLSGQFTDQRLLAIEQFSVGGVDSVRGYRENTFVRDNGVAATLELRVPIYQQPAKQIDVTLIPFFDCGYAYNHNNTPAPDFISSVGLGVSAEYTKHFSTQIFWGYPLNEVDESDSNLQDFGLHFQMIFRLF